MIKKTSPFKKRKFLVYSRGYAIFNFFYYTFVAVCLWIAVTCMIQRFKDPTMTETQIFMNIPNSALLNFTEGTNK